MIGAVNPRVVSLSWTARSIATVPARPAVGQLEAGDVVRRPLVTVHLVPIIVQLSLGYRENGGLVLAVPRQDDSDIRRVSHVWKARALSYLLVVMLRREGKRVIYLI